MPVMSDSPPPQRGVRPKGQAMGFRRRVMVAVPAVLTVLVPVAAFSFPGKSNSWAAGLPGCDPSHPAVAHHADQHVLNPQPTNGPVPCGVSTGWPTVENKVEVTNNGTVLYEPALQG